MPRTKGSKNRPKTNTTNDYASQIAEKQESIVSLTAEIASITANIDTLKADLKEKKTALKKAEKEVATLEAKKAKADAKAAEEAKKTEAESVLKKLLAEGMSADEILAEEVAGKRDECGRDSGKAEINKKTNNKNKYRVNSRSSHGIF